MMRPGHLKSAFSSKLFCLLLLLTAHATNTIAQTKADSRTEPGAEPKPTNYTVIAEHKEKDGSIVRTVQYEQGGQRIRETMTIRPMPVNLHKPINPDTLNKDSVLLVVDKSRFALEVWYRRRLVRSYKAVFGPKPMDNKNVEGDRCTPEGWFRILTKNPNSKYGKFMLLDYPNDTSMARFNKLKQHGAIPAAAQPGGNVGIHGTWKGGDDMIEKGVGWTDGCVAITNKDVDELYRFVATGTRVYIKK